MLAIKKRYIYPETYLYIALGVAVFGITIGTLYAVDPRFDTDRSVAIVGNKPVKMAATSETSAADNQNSGNKDEAAQSQAPATSPAQPAVVAATPAAASTTQPATSNDAQPSATPVASPATDTTPTQEPVETDPTPTTPEPTPDDTQQPSLLGNVVGGVLGVVDTVL